MSGILATNGKTSSVRIAMFMCIILAGAIALLGVWKGQDPLGLASLCGVFIGGGMGAKVAQKGKENA